LLVCSSWLSYFAYLALIVRWLGCRSGALLDLHLIFSAAKAAVFPSVETLRPAHP
jgi:hypothetical protein